ncbi:aminopeptidase P family protein [Clostridium sp.]|uniref:aminopeptidase P family protein n=1 Tax=Clostridium sp. TaxID=1506 RepID=UPI00260AA349|nr:aminopeptidase P family protein [Clostridium sp.]
MNNLQKFREVMKKEDIDFYILPSSDSHQSEYVAEYFKGREYISGFTGSAGTVVVGIEEAYLWTDGRYFIQATKEIEKNGLKLMKIATAGYPTLEEWISDNIKENKVLGFDGRLISVKEYEGYKSIADKNNFEIIMSKDLLKGIWDNRKELPKDKIFNHDESYCGKSISEKLIEVRENLKIKKASSFILSSLDDIAWLYNIRGNDVLFNPVALSYALISDKKASLYIDESKVTKEVYEKLKSQGVNVFAYDKIEDHVKELKGTVILDKSKLNAKVFSALNDEVKVINELNYTTKLKAIKNETEIASMEKSQVRDGVAMVKFMKWLRENIEVEKVTEFTAGEKLTSIRALGENYKGDSFNTIAGYKENAAMMHYSATEDKAYELKPERMLLVDSGAQYLDGTTDITRTFILGPVSEEEKRDYTLVLKGHIGLTLAKFLKGTTGMNLDILARRPLWNYGLDYKCGTGHGVGFFLNVHEGPQGIRQSGNTTILEPGMVITNEPGVYKEGKHGIRIENTLIVERDVVSKECGEFYKFRTISYCPIDLRGIDVNLLTLEEKDWLNNYHNIVFEKLSPYLNKDEIEFLKNETRKI